MTPGDMTPVVLAGPTGVGKSALALAVAELRPVGIVSLDARQIYRGMELGSDAPSAVALERVPHRGVGERELDQPWSAGQAAVDARRWAAEFQAEGRLPIVLGGSGLYLQALLVGLDRGPRAPWRCAAIGHAHGAQPCLRQCCSEGMADSEFRGA